MYRKVKIGLVGENERAGEENSDGEDGTHKHIFRDMDFLGRVEEMRGAL